MDTMLIMILEAALFVLSIFRCSQNHVELNRVDGGYVIVRDRILGAGSWDSSSDHYYLKLLNDSTKYEFMYLGITNRLCYSVKNEILYVYLDRWNDEFDKFEPTNLPSNIKVILKIDNDMYSLYKNQMIDGCFELDDSSKAHNIYDSKASIERFKQTQQYDKQMNKSLQPTTYGNIFEGDSIIKLTPMHH